MSTQIPYPFSPCYLQTGGVDPGGMSQGGISPGAARKPSSIHEESSPDDSNAASLTSKINSIFLETPTLPHPPDFSQSPLYGSLHTPPSAAVLTPALTHGKFQNSPDAPFEITGFRETANRESDFESVERHSGIVSNPFLQEHHSLLVLEDSFRDHVPYKAVSGFETELEYEDDTTYMSAMNLSPEKQEFSTLDPAFTSVKEDTLTIEQFLLQDPFVSIEKIPEIDENLLNEKSPLIPQEFDSQKKEMHSLKSTPRKPSFSVKSKLTESLVSFSPKVIRKLKSFSAAISKTPKEPYRPNFSFEDCSSEFHITDGNYAFQDETASVSMQCGPEVSAIKKKIPTKSSKQSPKPLLRKAKSTFSLCLQASYRSNPKVLRNMESGLVSFQLQLKNIERNSQKS